jgi:hypothetical protein
VTGIFCPSAKKMPLCSTKQTRQRLAFIGNGEGALRGAKDDLI